MTLSIIIVNHNVRCFLEQCLLSLRRATEGIRHEIVVVDNASRDDSRSYLPERFPEVRFIWNERNSGFGRACNQGATLSSGQFILFLNPDTIVPEDCLHRCLEHIEAHPTAAALGVRMHDGSGRYLRESKRSYPSPLTAFLKLSGLSALFPGSRWIARYDLGDRDAFANCRADVLAGAFMLVRREAFSETGGFDERFFMYGEDIDLSWRFRHAGFENLYFAEAPILHFKGPHVRHFYGAMSVFVRKHHPGPGVWLLLPAIGLRASMAVVRIWISKALGRVHGFMEAFTPGFRARDTGEVQVLATDLDLPRVEEILARASHARVCRVDWQHLGQDLSVGDAKAVSGKEFVVCPPACRYGEVVGLLARHPGRYRIRVSAEGSGGLVGSGLTLAL
ncbi:MAG: glycosyltransferase family 2 protein [Chitinophagia bacterium]|nr:glycosyltransferase family 2 protein [Chitinophagia bacterium]